MISVVGLNDLEGSTASSGVQTYRLSYKSFADHQPSRINETDVTRAVVEFAGIDIGTPYFSDPSSLCRSIRSRCIKRHDGQYPKWEWETAYEFSSQNEKEPTKDKDPTQRPASISISMEKYDRKVEYDIVGDPVVNSAGDPVVRMRKRGNLVFRWSRYLADWNWSNNAEAVKAINFGPTGTPINPIGFVFSRNYNTFNPVGPYSDLLSKGPITVFTRGEGLITDIKADIVYESNKRWVKVDIEIKYDELIHLDRFLDQGFFHRRSATSRASNPHWTDSPLTVLTSDEYSTATYTNAQGAVTTLSPTSDRVRFRDGTTFATTPQLLDGAGNPHQGPPTKPQYRSYQYYQFRDWGIPPLGGGSGFFDG